MWPPQLSTYPDHLYKYMHFDTLKAHSRHLSATRITGPRGEGQEDAINYTSMLSLETTVSE